MQEQLNSCPFCGSCNVEIGYLIPPFHVHCKDCGAQGPPSKDWTLAGLGWNAASLEWTKTPPTKAGFYFYRNFFGCIQVVNVFAGLVHSCQREGEWAGPIPVPGK